MNTPKNPDLPGWSRPPVTKTQVRNDAIGAAVLFGAAAFSMVLYGTSGVIDQPLAHEHAIWLLLAICAPLALRRVYPITVLLLTSAVFIFNGEMLVGEHLIQNIAMFVAFYTAGAWTANRKLAAISRVAVIAAIFSWLIISLLIAATDTSFMPEISREYLGWGLSPLLAYALLQGLTNALYFGGAHYFGNHAWRSARSRARLEFSNYQIVSQRRLLDLQAVELERMRLARELHDSVAHHVALMGVQAGAARILLKTKPEQASATLAEIEQSAHSAVTELQGLVRTLRDTPTPDFDFYYDDDAPTWAERPPTTAQFGTAQSTAESAAESALASIGTHSLRDLVAKHRSAGLPVEFAQVGVPRPGALSPVNELNAYRICQEALTNVRKHAPYANQVQVVLRHLDDGVEVEVTNSFSRGRTRADSSGFGLVGMRERVDASGGQLQAGPLAEGGFQVRAVLPYEPAALDIGANMSAVTAGKD